MYARGILFGKMKYELGDHSFVRCPENHLVADLEFKTKGYFTGTYNAIGGKVTKGSKTVGEITGKWSDSMDYKDSATGKLEELFDAHKATIVQKEVIPEDQQEENESRRLWSKVTEGIKEKDLDKATESKSAIEEKQRALAKEREESGATWEPRFFVQKGDKYYPKMDAMPSDDYRSPVVVEYFAKST